MKTKVLKNIPANALKILAKLSDDEYSAYVVGGAVRDSILERKVHDIDIATSATPNEVINVFKDYKVIPVGIKHGTVAVAIKGEQFEITTLRIDGKYTDNRSPETIEFTRNIKDDVKRRDFTINSLAFNLQEGVIDYEDGLKDIKNKVIRAVGNPNKRFEEDSLRILRALRFASHLGFEIEKETQKAIVDKKDLLKNISSERINKELTGILAGKNVKKILIENKEVIATFIPEIEEMFNYDQNNPYHNKNLWGHTIKTIESVNDSKEMKVAALLHDIGKPKTMTINKKGYSNYLGHSEKSTEIATVILKRLKYTNKETKEILDIIKNHSKNISINPYKIKRDIYTMGTKSFFNMLDFKEADNKGKKSDNLGVIKENDKIRYIRKFAKEYLDGNPILSHTDLEITPRHLIDIGLKGKDIGDTLDKLVLLALNGQPNELKRQLKYVETRIVNN